MINLTATLTTCEGRGAEFEAAFARARPAVLAEPGCLRYDLQRRHGSATEYVVLESYDSEDAIRRHVKSAATHRLRVTTRDMVIAEPIVVVLEPCGDQVHLARASANGEPG